MDFCTNCGSPLNGSNFCTKCGTRVEGNPLNQPVSVNPGFTGDPNVMGNPYGSTNGSNKKTGPIAAILAVVAVIALCFFIFGGRSYKSVIKKYYDAKMNGNAKEMISLMHDDMVDYDIEEVYDGDKDDMYNAVEDWLKNYIKSYKSYGYDFSKLSYEIKYVDDLDEDDLKNLKKRPDVKKSKVKIKAAKDIEVKVKVPAEDEDEDSKDYTDHIKVVKIGRSWYILDPY